MIGAKKADVIQAASSRQAKVAAMMASILGIGSGVRNGYQGITVRFTIRGDAPAEKLRELVEQSRARSAVYDVLTNGVPVSIEVDAG